MAKAFISGVDAVVLQEKVVDITENGTVEVIPDEGKLLRKVTAKIDTPVPKEEQEKNLTVTKDGTYRVLPDEGKVLSAVNVEVDTPDKKEEQEKVVQINGNGTIDILPDTGKVLSRVTAVVNVEGGSDAPDVPDIPDAPVTPEYSEGLEIVNSTVYGIGACTDDIIVIPEEHQGLPVTTLYGPYSGSFKQIIMPDSMEYIEHGICECPNLERVEFGSGLESINYWCFNNNPKCKEYDFTRCTHVPMLHFYFDEITEGYSFEGMPSDCKMIVPDALLDEWSQATNWTLYADYIVVKEQETAQEKTIEITENGSYEVIPDEGKLLSKVGVNVNVSGGGDSNALDVLIEGSLTEISSNAATVRSYAIYQAGKLESASFPNATDIGSSAFHYCEALKSIYFPKATSIGQSAFSNCKALTSVDFPNVTTIGDNAFSYSSKLKSADIPNATSIGQSAFSGCSELTSVDFPNVTSMSGGSCFRNCLKLTSVRIPRVESIGGYTFYGCAKCLEYDFSGCVAVPTLSNVNAFQNINSNAQIKVPAALYDEWIAATNWTTYAKYIVAV